MGCVIMAKCPFLTTEEEVVECFKDCALYKIEGSNKCPFLEVKNTHPIKVKNIYDFDIFTSDEDSPVSILCGERYY